VIFKHNVLLKNVKIYTQINHALILAFNFILYIFFKFLDALCTWLRHYSKVVAGVLTTQPKQGRQAAPMSSLCILLCLWV